MFIYIYILFYFIFSPGSRQLRPRRRLPSGGGGWVVGWERGGEEGGGSRAEWGGGWQKC